MGRGGNTHNLEKAPSKRMVCKLKKNKNKNKKLSSGRERSIISSTDSKLSN